MTWVIEVSLQPHLRDAEKARVEETAAELHLPMPPLRRFARLYIVGGRLDESHVRRAAEELLADPVADTYHIHALDKAPANGPERAYVLFHVGVMDPVALTCLDALREMGLPVEAVRTGRMYEFTETVPESVREAVAYRVLANDAIEEVHWGQLPQEIFQHPKPYRFQLQTTPLLDADDKQLLRISREGMLALDLDEMKTIRSHYRALGREPTDIELETIAQTWSEHCSHKTLKGPVHYVEVDAEGNVLREIRFRSLLGETVFRATRTLRDRWGERDWCVKVFADNAGIVRFHGSWNLCFKVETHNHPSAIEPYGGASTGVGGVIRDILGCGLGARPIANTDVFCVGELTLPPEDLPAGVLHPRRVLKGVVAGVRDYGNRMGIPTVNGAILSEPEYLGNPLVYCGCLGLIPAGKEEKAPRDGDLIVVVGGRTGRDGIHGATFSSVELHSESAEFSGGAVQIGNPITQKKMLDVLLVARDRGLFHAITDCGAGGFSSAVGEMADGLGAEVWLDRAPLKYAGLSYTEIWISESQERMVLAVPEDRWPELRSLCQSEGVEATVIGRFQATGKLVLKYHEHRVGTLDLEFLHRGCPRKERRAQFRLPPSPAERLVPEDRIRDRSPGELLLELLADPSICSKHWVIRQYDHEVQGASVVKPLVGRLLDGPSDAAVLRPVPDASAGVALACGINPRYGRVDPYRMTLCAIDEAVRNCVSVGADPERIALLDNFCWGNTNRPEQLGSLVRAALACHDGALAYNAPFISGKDSLNNEFQGERRGERLQLVIPPTILISALGIVPDIDRCVTMDFKETGNAILLVGATRAELGQSALARLTGWAGGEVPTVDLSLGPAVARAVAGLIRTGLVRACHDVSEGGVLVALAEMAFAGALGAEATLPSVDALAEELETKGTAMQLWLSWLCSESPSRYLLEIPPDALPQAERALSGLVPYRVLGTVTKRARLSVRASDGTVLLDVATDQLKAAWQAPLDW